MSLTMGLEPRDDLCGIEKSLLWGIRAWVIGHRWKQDVERPLAELFDGLGVPRGLPHLDRFMRALSHGATRTLTVNCVCFSDYSRDERALLDVLALEQCDRGEDAFVLLTGFLHENAACEACAGAAGLVHELNRASYFLPGPESAGFGPPRRLH